MKRKIIENNENVENVIIENDIEEEEESVASKKIMASIENVAEEENERK